MQLERQASRCEFGLVLDDMIRDQIVIGIIRDDTRRRLLSNPKLNLEKAVEILQVEQQVGRAASCFSSSHQHPQTLLAVANQSSNAVVSHFRLPEGHT